MKKNRDYERLKTQTMSVKYEIHTIENAQGTGRERQYVQLRNGETKGADQLERQIEAACSMTRGDVKAVMVELRRYAVQELTAGNHFHLPEIGYLSLSAGIPAEAERGDKRVTGNDIYLRGINFRPEAGFLREVKSGVRFQKSTRSTRSKAYTEDELWAKTEAYLAQNRYLTRRDMQLNFGLSYHKAALWLARFTAEGRLVKDGTPHRPLYFLASETEI